MRPWNEPTERQCHHEKRETGQSKNEPACFIEISNALKVVPPVGLRDFVLQAKSHAKVRKTHKLNRPDQGHPKTKRLIFQVMQSDRDLHKTRQYGDALRQAVVNC